MEKKSVLVHFGIYKGVTFVDDAASALQTEIKKIFKLRDDVDLIVLCGSNCWTRT